MSRRGRHRRRSVVNTRRRLRWDYERRRSAAHARMPSTFYASSPDPRASADVSCPGLVGGEARHVYRRFLEQRGGLPNILNKQGMATWRSRADTRRTIPRSGQDAAGASSSSSHSSAIGNARSHLTRASAWMQDPRPSNAQTETSETSQTVWLFPSASEPLREGFVRVINHSTESGEVSITAVDDSGRRFDAVALTIGGNETVHFNSGDLETGNESKGLSGGTGSGQGDWRLGFSSGLDIEVLAYVRTADGFLTAMHDVAPSAGNTQRVPIFNPGSNRDQVSRLRLVNPGTEAAQVTIRGNGRQGPGRHRGRLADARRWRGNGDHRVRARIRCGRARRHARRRFGQVAARGRVGTARRGDEPAVEPDGAPDEPVDGAGPRARGNAPGTAVPVGVGRERPAGLRSRRQPLRRVRRDRHRGVRRRRAGVCVPDVVDRRERDEALQL